MASDHPVSTIEKEIARLEGEIARLKRQLAAPKTNPPSQLRQDWAIQEILPDLIIRLSRNGIFLEYSGPPDSEDLYLPPDFFLGKTIDEVMPPVLTARIRKHIELAFATQSVSHFEYQLETAKGQEFYEARVAVSGPNEVTGIIRNITDRMQAEEALRLSEEKYRTMFDAAQDALVLIEPEGRTIVDANASALKLYGYERDELLGRSALELSANPEFSGANIAQTIASGEGLFRHHNIHKRRDGGTFEVEITSTMIRTQSGYLLYAVFRDISAQVERERMLEESRRALEIAQETARIGSWEFNHLTGEGRWSREMYRLHGLDPTSNPLPLEEYYKLVHPEDVPKILATQAKTQETRQRVTVEFRSNPEHGPIRWFQGTSQLIDSEDLDGVMVVGTVQDITERVKTQEAIRLLNAELEERVARRTAELEVANQKLQELDRLKTKFIDDVSHELRTPVTSLRVYLHLLAHGDPDRQDRYLADLRKQTDRLLKILDRILTFTTAPAAVRPRQIEDVDLNRLVADAAADHRLRIPPGGPQLIFEPDGGLPPIRGVTHELVEIAENLLANAVSYTRTGTIRVTTGAGVDGERIFLRVADTGPGMDSEELAHCFDRFYRGKLVGQSNIPGSGLGLAIVKERVEDHCGRIEVESEPGVGTTFTIWLPTQAD